MGELIKRGAPTKYRPEFCEDIITFFDREPFKVATDDEGNALTTQTGKPLLMACELPTFEKFASDIGVHKDSIYEWAKVHPEFSDAKKIAQQLQYNILVQNGLLGGYNSTFAIFTGKAALGMRDGGEADKGEAKPLTIEFTVEDARTRAA